MTERTKAERARTLAWLVIATLSIANAKAYAQTTTVRGSITDQTRVKVIGSSVLVKDTNGSIKAAPEAPKGDYLIPAIPLGKYEFIACGMPFRPTHNSVNLASEQATTINLVLDDPYDAPKLPLTPDNMEDSIDSILYLRDAKSGCLVAQAQANRKGQYVFTNWHTGDELCKRTLRKDKSREEYVCSTLNVPSVSP